MARKKKDPTPVLPELDANRHHDTRKNIPTEELRDFVAEDESKPPKMLYPRDPSLDPQLVWKGKDEQDREPLEVDIVPIYIQEVIEPRVIIDAVQSRKRTKPETSGFLPGFFDDFEAMDFDRKIEFYQHDQKWANRMILGNSLHVMTSLAEKEGLKGKVQMIYIDPPYGIKFGSNWQVSTRKRNVRDGKEEDTTRQPEQVRAFRDTWKLGIHSYLAVLRDWLVVASDLLTETGGLFLQIGDQNMHLVRSLMDEVFGSENYVATISVQKTGSTETTFVPRTVDYLLLFAKHLDSLKYRQLYLERTAGTTTLDRYDWIRQTDSQERRLTSSELSGLVPVPEGRRFRDTALVSARPASGSDVREFDYDGQTFNPGSGTFKTDLKGLRRLGWASRLRASGRTLQYIRYVDDFPVVPLNDRWESVQIGTELTYVVQTGPKVIERCLLMCTDPGDLVLDSTCGSGTTAYVAEQWGRRWITIDTSP